MIDEPEPLNLLDKDEWWDVCRLVRPDISREQFESAWDEFCEMKRRKELQ